MRFGNATAAVVLGLVLAGGRPPANLFAAAEPQRTRFTNGASSIDGLLDQFMKALNGKDKQALRALRVTEGEYRQVVLPGSVDEGQRKYTYPPQESEYFWSILNTKSIYGEANILASYGGRQLKLKSVKYRGGTKKYADYTAYKQVQLTLEDGKGSEEELGLGSIAEVDGVYKFISYVRK